MTASPAPGMPSAEAIEAEIRPMAYEAADLTECVERILDLIRPAFEAKEREIAALTTRAEDAEFAMSRVQKETVAAERRALSAEAKLAQAVEALKPFKLIADGISAQTGVPESEISDDTWVSVRLVECRRARAAAAMGEKT